MKQNLIPQYKIFYSWQSDISISKELIEKALDKVSKSFSKVGIALKIEQGGGGFGFVSIEDAVRMKIQECDIFLGDITPVGNVNYSSKLLPNANVMYEMGIATEVLDADRILAVATKGIWKVENMPFDFNHYSMFHYDPTKADAVDKLAKEIEKRIEKAKEKSIRDNSRYFEEWVVDKNISSGKYLPDTFLEKRRLKEKVRCFVEPTKYYHLVFQRIARFSFSRYNEYLHNLGKKEVFKLNLDEYNLINRAYDLPKLYTKIDKLTNYLNDRIAYLDQDGNKGWRTAIKIKEQNERLSLMNKRTMVLLSEAGQGKTNFICDMVHNVLKTDGVPFVLVNAYELSADKLAQSIAFEHNYIGSGSLEEVIMKAEKYCNQHRQYLVIIVDGLNEQPLQKLFISNLAKIVKAIKGYNHVKLLMTCRTAFFDKNYTLLKSTLGDDLITFTLDRNRGENLEQNEEECLMERYMAHFDIKGILKQNVANALVRKPILLRLFFEAHKGEDVSGENFFRADDVYEKYYSLMCNNAQQVISQDPTIGDAHGVVEDVFNSILEWMLENGVMRNIPSSKIKASLDHLQLQCFNHILNSNLLLQFDLPEQENIEDDIINFTFEEIREFLISRYLLNVVLPESQDKFNEYVLRYADSNQNTAEGLRRYLFLQIRNKQNDVAYNLLKAYTWFDDVYFSNIWYVDEDKIVDEDLQKVGNQILIDPNNIILNLVIMRWNKDSFPKLNIGLFFNVFNKQIPELKGSLLEKVWPSKTTDRWTMRGYVVESKRSKFVDSVQKALVRRIKNGEELNAELIQLLETIKEVEGEHGAANTALKKIEKLNKEEIKKDQEDNAFVNEFYCYDTFCYLMTIGVKSREDFLERAGAKRGFAAKTFGDLYDAIFVEAEDVQTIFEMYYKDEYRDFSHYISMHYNIPMATVEGIVNSLNEGKRLIDFNSIDFGNDQVDQFIISDEMFDRFYELLK